MTIGKKIKLLNTKTEHETYETNDLMYPLYEDMQRNIQKP